MPTKPTGRPRGRPKGSKNIPPVDVFVADSLANSLPIPVLPSKPKRGSGPWAGKSREERSAYGRALRAKVAPENCRGGKKPGVPAAYTKAQWEIHVAMQKPFIAKVLKKLADNDRLPDDPMAVEALEQTMLILRSQVPSKEKLTAARLLLDFTTAKPAATVEQAVRTAEDYLDELSEDEEYP